VRCDLLGPGMVLQRAQATFVLKRAQTINGTGLDLPICSVCTTMPTTADPCRPMKTPRWFAQVRIGLHGSLVYCCLSRRQQLARFWGLWPDIQDLILVLTVWCVPGLLDSGTAHRMLLWSSTSRYEHEGKHEAT